MTKEEAIEVYNGLINPKIKEAFEFFAPELRESEDERIRKFICSIIDNLEPKDFVGVKKMKVLDYLEKQKEQREATPETCLKGIFDFDDISQLELAVDCYKEKKGRAYPVTVKHQHKVLMKLYDLIGIDREALDQDKEVE